MTGPDVVFCGPTLPAAEILQRHPNAVVLPPARMGDVSSALLRYRPHAVGIIDGRFRTTMSVFHKEILRALEAGVWVLGSSSMGALRAAECEAFGMIGVGEIFRAVVSGALEDDDEVAVMHGDESTGYRCTSDALVTIRAALADLVDNGTIEPEHAVALAACQASRWFPDRRIRDLPADALSLGLGAAVADRLRCSLATPWRDPKRDDAIALVERLLVLPPEPRSTEHRVRCVRSARFEALLAREPEIGVGVPDLRADDLRYLNALLDSNYEDDLDIARLKTAVSRVSTHLFGPLSDEELAVGRQRVARLLGVEPTELTATALGLDLDEEGLDRMVERESHVCRLARSDLGSANHGAVTGPYLDELRLQGRYEQARARGALLHGASREATWDPRTSLESVVATFGGISSRGLPADVAGYLRDAELGSAGELIEAVTLVVRAATSLFGVDVTGAEETMAGVAADSPWGSRGR